MRDIIVGDVDKRIASFLQAPASRRPRLSRPLRASIRTGRTIASSDPRLIGVSPPPAGGWRDAIAARDVVLLGPVSAARRRPARARARRTDRRSRGSRPRVIGALLALYDWSQADGDRRRRLSRSRRHRSRHRPADGRRRRHRDRRRRARRQRRLSRTRSARRRLADARSPVGADRRDYVYEPAIDALVGRARLGAAVAGLDGVRARSPAREALAPVRRMRQRLGCWRSRSS